MGCVDRWRAEESRGLANPPGWKDTQSAISSVHISKKSASAAAHSSQLYSSVWKGSHIQSSKTSHIFSKSGYTFLEVSQGLTLQELLILLSSFQKLFFKLTKESEEEEEIRIYSHF